MKKKGTESKFKAKLLSPELPEGGSNWLFIILPQVASQKLPRRGRLTVGGSINGSPFKAMLEPDGKKSHWLKIDEKLRLASAAAVGEHATFEIYALEDEPEPDIPKDLEQAISETADAKETWLKTTTLARVDWIHWVESAKTQKTRHKRIVDAVEMLASGKRRVCCFDPSGFYSKALSAPKLSQK